MIITLDEVATELLVNAISAAGRWLGTAATASRHGRGAAGADLAVARWSETYRLTGRIPELSGLPSQSEDRLRTLLEGNAAQAAVQELLAVRLTDGSNANAATARQAFVLTLATADDPEISARAEALADYYDDEISRLVGHLADGPILAQIRSEALSGRMISVLHAIERHTAALSARPAPRTESDFLTRYRAHVVEQHGKLEPPDFERRRRVPIADIHVPTMIHEERHPERGRLALDTEPPSMTVWELADRLDRTVLLGDPGGGKTTASTVLMHHFASDARQRIPFLVTLRNFAAEDPPARSVVGFIEHELETLYQCPAPPGSVELLLLTGRAVVIFDGLDELLDSSRRADVATRIERFCAEYPLAPTLVTSRVIGYDQARLDESQFTAYRLGGFRNEHVAEYARKWFALDEGAHPDDADAFISESEGVPDLRSNPLLLSLICILYRGEGSLPRNRAEVYEQCANLLFRRWDARRHIHQNLRAGRLIEPALRHLAAYLASRADTEYSVPERELIAVTSAFLHGKGFESYEEALDAACEFIEFCRGRLWVFSDTGTATNGARLYGFTHRTFMEYFAAAQLAYDSDTPEKLANTIAPHIARGEWEVVGELAVQIKDRTSTDGADRFYKTLLGERRRRSAAGRSHILQFLARSLRSVDPSPQVTRELTGEIVNFLFASKPNSTVHELPLAWLLGSCTTCAPVVDDEISRLLEIMISSEDEDAHRNGLLLGGSLYVALWGNWGERGPSLPYSSPLFIFWSQRASKNVVRHRDHYIAAAEKQCNMMILALRHNLITIDRAFKICQGPYPLLTDQPMGIFGWVHGAYLSSELHLLITEGGGDSRGIMSLRETGEYVARHPAPPWTSKRTAFWSDYKLTGMSTALNSVDPMAYLGATFILLISAESEGGAGVSAFNFGAYVAASRQIYAYVQRRYRGAEEAELPYLPVPEEFSQVFRDWAAGKVNFIGPARLPAGPGRPAA